MGVQTTASVRDETQLIFHGATDSEEGSEDLSKTKISLYAAAQASIMHMRARGESIVGCRPPGV